MKKNDNIICDGVSYTLIEEIGEGGKGDVWKVEANHYYYAVKFFKLNQNTKDKKRFEQEIIFCKDNYHDNIVKCIGQGVHRYTHKEKPVEQSYYIMPFYKKTFKDIIKEINDVQTFILYFLQLCDAVKFIHDKGVFHRDIKPENILWDEANKNIYLADFGIAHFPNSSMTILNDKLANFNYHAPEQKKNSGFKITAAADIYALGLILNECFTKQIICGVNFKKVNDVYPIYRDIDTLIENMITQIPDNRFKIDMVIIQLKLVTEKIESDIENITDLIKPCLPELYNEEAIKKAASDIAFASKVFYNNDIKHINRNWHMANGIRYSTSKWLSNLYVQEQLLKIVKSKFHYESGGKDDYPGLDLSKTEDKVLYDKMLHILEKYKLRESCYNLSGKILKYFRSCCDYHCREILDDIEGKESDNDFLKNIKQAPILWIVHFLKQELTESLLELQNDSEFEFFASINIDWEQTNIHYNGKVFVDDLTDSIYYSGIKEAEDTLYKFKEFLRTHAIEIQTKLEDDFYLVYITDSQWFDFRKVCLEALQEKVDIVNNTFLEYDTADLFCIHKNYKNVIIFRWSVIWDINHTIKKLLEVIT